MSKKQKLFIIRGFDPSAESFSTPVGVIATNILGGAEVEAPNVVAATAVMMVHPVISQMMPHNSSGDDERQSQDGSDDVYHLKIKIATHFSEYSELRPYRTAIWKTILEWAEKSRVKNLRGFRASAVKELTCKKDRDTGDQVVLTEVLLSTNIIYASPGTAIIGGPNCVTHVQQDLNNLSKQLQRVTGGSAGMITATHSKFNDQTYTA